jgi:hypothetical protein
LWRFVQGWGWGDDVKGLAVRMRVGRKEGCYKRHKHKAKAANDNSAK